MPVAKRKSDKKPDKTAAKQREVATEIAQVLIQPLWEDIAWISVMDLYAARDHDVTGGEILPEHLACNGIARDDWERVMFLRSALTPEHTDDLIDALEHTQRPGVVELLAWTCGSTKELKAALKKGEAKKELQPAIDYAMRRFVAEPGVSKQLGKRAMPFATSAAGGKWQVANEQAWRALYVCDTRESADVVAEMIETTYVYTNLGVKERISAAAAKRARMLKERKRCAAPLRVAAGESYTGEEFAHSAAVIEPAKTKRILEEKWKEYTEYQMDNHPAQTALGALLALAPTSKVYQNAAKKVLPKMLKERENVGWDDIGRVNGIVMGIERGKIRALHPLLEKVARWKITGSPYDNHGKERAELAAELVRRRARRALDAG